MSFLSSGGRPGAPALRADLDGMGPEVTGALELRTMVRDVIRAAPEVVVCTENHPGDALFAVTSAPRKTPPRPLVPFTADPGAERIARAASARIYAGVVDG